MHALKFANFMLFLSTLSLRRATDTSALMVCQAKFLSTLSLRRATGKPYKLAGHKLVFLSTLSLRRATPSGSKYSGCSAHFYPRSPCGERRRFRAVQNTEINISIHALLAESDCYSFRHSASRWYFYPRSPCGERPHIRSTSHGRPDISIHALLAESDCLFFVV